MLLETKLYPLFFAIAFGAIATAISNQHIDSNDIESVIALEKVAAAKEAHIALFADGDVRPKARPSVSAKYARLP